MAEGMKYHFACPHTVSENCMRELLSSRQPEENRASDGKVPRCKIYYRPREAAMKRLSFAPAKTLCFIC
jgi:hypothetical protein